MDKLIEFLKNLCKIKFSGSVVITFNDGGVRSFKANIKNNS